MKISIETKYNAGDILHYMGIDGPIKCKVLSVRIIATGDPKHPYLQCRYSVQTYPIKDNHCLLCGERELYLTKAKCKKAFG